MPTYFGLRNHHSKFVSNRSNCFRETESDRQTERQMDIGIDIKKLRHLIISVRIDRTWTKLCISIKMRIHIQLCIGTFTNIARGKRSESASKSPLIWLKLVLGLVPISAYERNFWLKQYISINWNFKWPVARLLLKRLKWPIKFGFFGLILFSHYHAKI